MRQDFRFTGSGGQGVILLSVILADSYSMYENMEVAQTQSYGPEARGGTCRSELVVSDQLIDYVKVSKVKFFIAFNESGFRKYCGDITPDTIIFVNSSLIDEKLLAPYQNNIVYSIPATDIAEEKFKPFTVNILMLGYMTAKLEDLSFSSVEKAVETYVPAKHLKLNREALAYGYEMGV